MDKRTGASDAPRQRPAAAPAPRPWLVLGVICVSVYVINLDITIVNAALPSLVTELGATNRDLQWVVDAYLLTFAGFVLAAGSLADRYGRRGALVLGLVIFGGATTVGATADSVEGLIAARAVMGLGAAVIFPTTLAIISHAFPDRRLRARAFAIWGAVTGVGVATGPLSGGWLLEHFWWGSGFLALAPVAAVAVVLTLVFVPTSRDPATPRVDVVGLALSVATVGLVVHTIIEAPQRSWASPTTLLGLGGGLLLLGLFVAWERTRAEPMVDVSLFADVRFSAACVSVTVAWFSLFGFILLITQYFQYFKRYDPFTYGQALGPVAGSIAAGSVAGIVLAMRFGARWVVSGGLALMGGFFLWVTTISSTTSYWPTIVGQMLVLGFGLGLTTAPATETIMDVVPSAKAAVGSAMNDATRELGGTLGVAVTGSVFASAYAASLAGSGSLAGLPPAVAGQARESVGAALALVPAAADPAALGAAVDAAFYAGLQPACFTVGFVALAGAQFAAVALPARRRARAATADRAGAARAGGPRERGRRVPRGRARSRGPVSPAPRPDGRRRGACATAGRPQGPGGGRRPQSPVAPPGAVGGP